MNPPDQPTLAPTPRTLEAAGTPSHDWEATADRLFIESQKLETELAAAQSERDLAITRVASILWSGAIDKHTCGDVQKWADYYTAENTCLRAEVERLTACLKTANGNHEQFERQFYLEQARAEKAEAELGNIANAKPHTWGDMSDEFQAWAQNRARHALAAMKGTL
jgi:hypothetical protein